jgi:hypothetical protein
MTNEMGRNRHADLPPRVAVDTVIAVKRNFYRFVSRWHESVLDAGAA